MKSAIYLLFILVSFSSIAEAQTFASESAREAGKVLAKGDTEGAVAILTRAIESKKDVLEALILRGNIRGMVGNITGAIADYSAALEINPTDARTYEKRAMYRGFRRDHVGALEDYNAAIANGSKGDRIYAARAVVKQDLGNLNEAEVDFQTALAYNPNNGGAYVGLAHLLERKGENDRALVLLQRFLDHYEEKNNGKLPSMHSPVTASINIKRRGQEKDGGQAYMIGTTTNSVKSSASNEDVDADSSMMEQIMNMSMAYFSLGRLFAKNNEFKKAIASYDKGLKINKNDVLGYQLRSEVRMKLNDLPGTIADLKLAEEAPMHLPDRHLYKGLLLFLQGKDADAKVEFDLHLLRFPNAKESVDKKIQEAERLRKGQQ